MHLKKSDIENFLKNTDFSGYQMVPLPFGLKVPGRDRSESVDYVLSNRVEGKSVLDIGTYYGLFPCEAVRRGATRVVGIEMDSERFIIARKIADFYGNSYTIINGNIEDDNFVLHEKFDVVLLLNVLHHVLKPITTMKKIVKYSTDTVIVEFCLPSDPEYLEYLYIYRGRYLPRRLRKLTSQVHAHLIRLCGLSVPLMAIGNREYHRTFYFSRKAFFNLFVIHNRLFDDIQFYSSPWKKHRAIAVCKIAN
jgi:SAM-dependent methyltransferase